MTKSFLALEVLSGMILWACESRFLAGPRITFELEDGWIWISSSFIDDELDEEALEYSEVIRRMVLVDSNLDEKLWVKFWGWKADLRYRLGHSRTDLIDDSVEIRWDE